MTDSDDPRTPAEEEVRRLLAGARHTGPTPPDVVARLDRVLEDLAHEPDRSAPVADLARRRRLGATLLVAAAAVVAIGVGLGQVVSPEPTSESSQAGASADAQDEGGDPGLSGPGQPKGPGNGAEGDAPVPTTGATEEKAALVELRRQHLTDDLTAARRGLDRADADGLSRLPSAFRAVGAACGADAWGRGRFVPASYGGAPAVVVFRPPMGDTQVADLFLCGSEEPVRSVTLPAP